jgi:hypothetical protein
MILSAQKRNYETELEQIYLEGQEDIMGWRLKYLRTEFELGYYKMKYEQCQESEANQELNDLDCRDYEVLGK